MALLDISLVTQTLINLIQFSFKASETWNPPGSCGSPTISPLPPDILKTESIGLYLYHIKEEPQYKNITPKGNDDPPIRYVPMGVTLFFQLTAHSNLQTEQAAYNEQKMMGIAIKALHDYPIIDDKTEITDLDGVKNKVFPLGLCDNDNRFRIILQPVDQHEATSYWIAGSTPMRLAAYYQVLVVLLEPEESVSRAGRVLEYDISIYTGGGPRIDGCENNLSFLIPDKQIPMTVILRPAQVPVGGKITFIGSGFIGKETHLLLKSNHLKKSCIADNPWQLTLTEKGADITVQKQIPDENGVNQTVIPGIYSACIKVKKQKTLSDGSVIESEHLSNECPFTITPVIDNAQNNILQIPANKILKINGYLFPKEEANGQLYPKLNILIGNTKLTGIKSTQQLGDWEFKVIFDNATQATSIQLKISGNISPNTILPIRIFVNGAESSPNWIKV